MDNFLKIIDKKDAKILIGGGIGLALVVLVVIFLIIGGKPEVDSDKVSGNTSHSSQEEGVDDTLLQEEKESETSNSDSTETETQEAEDTEDVSESQKEDGVSSEAKPSAPVTPSQPQQKPSSSEESKDESQEPEDTEEIPVVTEAHTINVVSAGGHKLYNAKINAYKDKAMTKLFTKGATSSKGVATLQLEKGKEYTITLSNVPEGYEVAASYSVTSTTTTIVLESSVITGKEYPSKRLKIGSVMYDFTVQSATGENIKLSEVIQNKDLVVLNFWYTTCAPCRSEFPYITSAYEKYKDRIEIIALDPIDNASAVKEFYDENPLPFKVASCEYALANLFGIEAYPVTIVIDHYGVVREIEEGAVSSESAFIKLFSKYL